MQLNEVEREGEKEKGCSWIREAEKRKKSLFIYLFLLKKVTSYPILSNSTVFKGRLLRLR